MLEFLESVIRDYGYLALFIGTFLEGETILLVAGYLASMGILDVWLCILAAFTGSLSGDQTAFYIGRYKGKQFIDKRPNWKCRVERIHKLLERFHEALILSFRFFYGVRNLTPFILGTTDIAGLKFFILNAIGAFVWAVSFAYAGYFFGTVVAKVLKDIKGTKDLRVERVTGQQYLTIEVDRGAIARHGINASDIHDIIETAVGGRKATEIYEGQRRFDAVVRYPEVFRNSVERIHTIALLSPNGAVVPLDDVAHIRLQDGPARISREMSRRRIVIGANLDDRDVGGYVAEAQQKIARLVDLPEGMPKDVMAHLKKVRVAGQALMIKAYDSSKDDSGELESGAPRFAKKPRFSSDGPKPGGYKGKNFRPGFKSKP